MYTYIFIYLDTYVIQEIIARSGDVYSWSPVSGTNLVTPVEYVFDTASLGFQID